jgi:hypothetical protein
MTGAFDHIEVYPEVDLRCSICGAVGDVEWVNVSMGRQVQQFIPGAVRCPNGPHQMSHAEWDAIKPAPPVRPAPNDPFRYSERGAGPRRRWWRK